LFWRDSAVKNIFGHWIIYNKLRDLSRQPLVGDCPQRHYSQWLGRFLHLVIEPFWYEPKLVSVFDYVHQGVPVDIVRDYEKSLANLHREFLPVLFPRRKSGKIFQL
jgi:hypothetical protein